MSVQILGILNITSDSFSDGGQFLDPTTAVDHAHHLRAAGADIIDVGAVSSNPKGHDVSVAEEIRRLGDVLPGLLSAGMLVSVDAFRSPVQRFALAQGVSFLNDIAGFADASFYPELADAPARLIVMHSVQGGRAGEDEIAPDSIPGRLFQFFDGRIAALERAGVNRHRLILDPGMGFFLGANPHNSLIALQLIPDLLRRYDLPVLISVSRKSFLGAITGRDVAHRGAATLSAEIIAVQQGATFIRTHQPDSTRDALGILNAFAGPTGN